MTAQLTPIPDIIASAKKLALITSESASAVKAAYLPHFTSFLELEAQAANIAVNAPKAAQRMRLDLRKIRTAADKDRKALGEEGRRYVDAVNEVYNILEERLRPIELRMEGIEKAEERAIEERQAQVKAARVAELTPFATTAGVSIEFYDLAKMPPVQYDQLLANTKGLADAKLAADAKIEADKVAAEAVRVKREADLAAENARLAKEAEERDKVEQEAQAKREAEAKKLAADNARKQRLADETAAAERAKAEAARLEAKKLVDQLAAAEKERQRLLDEAEAKIQAAAKAPDKTKLAEFAKAIRALPVPTLSSKAGKPLAAKLTEQVTKFAAWVETEAGKL